MTTIVSSSSQNYAVMLADQGITSDLMHPDMGKVVQQGTWLIGVCGEDRVCDVLQYTVTYPKVPQILFGKPIEKWYPWVVKQVVPKIASAVDHGLHKSYRGTLGDSEVLLVTHGHTFLIGETLGVSKGEPYWAVGSGSHLAMGAMSTAYKSNPDWNSQHSEFAYDAIKTAQIHDPYTRGKITGYKSLPSGQVQALAYED